MLKKKNRKRIISTTLWIAVVVSFYLLSEDIQKQKKIQEIHELRIKSQMELLLHHEAKFRYLEKYLKSFN
jgi:hypothetical protein